MQSTAQKHFSYRYPLIPDQRQQTQFESLVGSSCMPCQRCEIKGIRFNFCPSAERGQPIQADQGGSLSVAHQSLAPGIPMKCGLPFRGLQIIRKVYAPGQERTGATRGECETAISATWSVATRRDVNSVLNGRESDTLRCNWSTLRLPGTDQRERADVLSSASRYNAHQQQ